MNTNRFVKSVRVIFVGLASAFSTVSVLALCFESESLAPVSYWSFDNRVAPVVDNAGDNNGTIVGAGAVWTASGHESGAINFDGNSHVLIADNNSLDVQLSGGFTIAAWVKPGNTDNFPVITKASGNLLVGSYVFFVRGGDRLLDCYVAESSSRYRGRASSIVFPDDGQFHHVACTWDGLFTLDSLHLYIDGVQVDGTTDNRTFGNPSAMRVDDTPLKIGAFSDSSVSANGIIDEPVVFDHLLSAGEMSDLMEGVATTPCRTPFVMPLKNGKIVIIAL